MQGQAPRQACSGDTGTATVCGLFPCLHFPSVLGDAAKDSDAGRRVAVAQLGEVSLREAVQWVEKAVPQEKCFSQRGTGTKPVICALA